MKKFQSDRGLGQVKEIFHVSRWEKQTESRLLLWAAVQPASLQQRISQWNRLQGIHTSVFPQMCPGLLITVVSVFELDLFGFIYMIMIPLLLGVNDVSLFSYPLPSGCYAAQALFECLWLLLYAHLLLLTGICNESLLNYRNNSFSTTTPASYIPAEMKNLFMYQEKEYPYLCIVQAPFILNVFLYFSLFPLGLVSALNNVVFTFPTHIISLVPSKICKSKYTASSIISTLWVTVLALPHGWNAAAWGQVPPHTFTAFLSTNMLSNNRKKHKK